MPELSRPGANILSGTKYPTPYPPYQAPVMLTRTPTSNCQARRILAAKSMQAVSMRLILRIAICRVDPRICSLEMAV
jgi:hypothetical protein